MNLQNNKFLHSKAVFVRIAYRSMSLDSFKFYHLGANESKHCVRETASNLHITSGALMGCIQNVAILTEARNLNRIEIFGGFHSS